MDVYDTTDVLSIALRQRRLIVLFALVVIVIPELVLIGRMTHHVPVTFQLAMRQLQDAATDMLVLCLVTPFICVIHVYRLAAAMRSKVAPLWALAVIVPLVNLVAVLCINSIARRLLRRSGLRIGILGAKRADLDALSSGAAVSGTEATGQK